MQNHALFLAMPEHPCMITRLIDEMREALKESFGGGVGGRNTVTPPSGGDLPVFAFTNLIVAPKPEPQLSPPALPVIETVKVDPRIQVERDNLIPTGLPDGANIPPSAGPGSEGGIGTGSRGGIGPDDGYGVGPGRDENIGDGGARIGGRRKPNSQQDAVDERPVLLNRPRPFYTEEARRNKVQGVVRVRILIEASGAVKEVIVVRGLPDGLRESDTRRVSNALQTRDEERPAGFLLVEHRGGRVQLEVSDSSDEGRLWRLSSAFRFAW